MPDFAPSGRLPPVEAVVRSSLLGRLPVAEIEVEIERQLEAFVAVWGRLPAHVDGHHHVHQLPGVRRALLRVLARHGAPKPYLRSCHEPLPRIMRRGVAQRKAAVISTLGAGFRRQASDAGFATNDGFSGIYLFGAADRGLDDLFKRFIGDLGPRPLAMCHPGYSDTTLAGLDTMTEERDAERAFLAGEGWLQVLAAAHVAVVPFAALTADEPA
jgi:predicted glycoside hydrolase/deacetylase ChbG (UPF0249 family)